MGINEHIYGNHRKRYVTWLITGLANLPVMRNVESVSWSMAEAYLSQFILKIGTNTRTYITQYKYLTYRPILSHAAGEFLLNFQHVFLIFVARDSEPHATGAPSIRPIACRSP